MAATTETVLPLYYVLSPVKAGGTIYKAGESVPLDDKEAKQLAADGIIEPKPIKVKTDKTPPSGEQTGTEQ